jgi:hypothetical protein
MLRNVESFWCPIRFYDGKKCDNCKLDFPDVARGWVRPEGTMAEVVQVMEAQYGDGQRTWFGHPTRLTLRGDPFPAGTDGGDPDGSARGNGNGIRNDNGDGTEEADTERQPSSISRSPSGGVRTPGPNS